MLQAINGIHHAGRTPESHRHDLRRLTNVEQLKVAITGAGYGVGEAATAVGNQSKGSCCAWFACNPGLQCGDAKAGQRAGNGSQGTQLHILHRLLPIPLTN
jgi:hypothetical protein